MTLYMTEKSPLLIPNYFHIHIIFTASSDVCICTHILLSDLYVGGKHYCCETFKIAPIIFFFLSTCGHFWNPYS